ncbi:MAG: hypothetical protein V1925_05220 [Candidatus Omnitrophota bacterium]
MNSRAQTSFEYMVMIALLVAALAAMTVYVKRGLQGRMRGAADQLSSEATYVPGGTSALTTTNRIIEEKTHTRIDRTDPDNSKSITDATAHIEQSTSRQEETQGPGGK